jgi:hypothetical protein
LSRLFTGSDDVYVTAVSVYGGGERGFCGGGGGGVAVCLVTGAGSRERFSGG